MHNDVLLKLADCSGFRQTILTGPPPIIHGTVVLLVVLLGTALLWSSTTRVNLIIRATGQVRPVTAALKVSKSRSGDVVSAATAGRIVAITFSEGGSVRKGDVLIRLDTERLDIEISKRKRIIQTQEEELARLGHLDMLLLQQFRESRAKAEAELNQLLAETRQVNERRSSAARLAELEVNLSLDEQARVQQLVAYGLTPQSDLLKSTTRLNQARERAQNDSLQFDLGTVEVWHRTLALTQSEQAVRRQDLATKQGIKRGEIEAARMELNSLELEHKQAVIRSPTDGIVTMADVEIGDTVEAGRPLLQIAEQKRFRFEITTRSHDIAHLRIGMVTRIKLDSYDYLKYGTLDGTVGFIAPDSRLTEGQQTSTYIVRIDLPDEQSLQTEFRGRIKLGMTGQAEILIGHESLLFLFMNRFQQTVSLG